MSEQEIIFEDRVEIDLGPDVHSSLIESFDPISLPLFVAVDRGCNMACWYCTEYGENRSGEGRQLNDDVLVDTLVSAYKAGIRTFRFTGGEPTLRRSLGEIMLATQELGSDVNLAMTTNGARLERTMPYLASLTRPSVFISVDSYDDITENTESEGNRVEKWLSPKLRSLLEEMPDNVQLRLNYVLTAANEDQLPKLIDYCVERGLDLKIFELLLRDYFYIEGTSSPEAFKDQYRSVRSLIPEFESRFGHPDDFAGTGGKGIPMKAFKAGDNSRVICFDSNSGSHYGYVCDNCSHFPCQEGLYALTLAYDGTLHPSGCLNESIYIDLASLPKEEQIAEFRRMASIVMDATFRPIVPDILSTTAGQNQGTPVEITRKK